MCSGAILRSLHTLVKQEVSQREIVNSHLLKASSKVVRKGHWVQDLLQKRSGRGLWFVASYQEPSKYVKKCKRFKIFSKKISKNVKKKSNFFFEKKSSKKWQIS